MKLEFKHKKSLGQNFLLNKEILKKISLIKKIENEDVLEIGPGKCYLTKFILKKKPAKLILIEKDKSLEPFLLKFIEKSNENINLIMGDALKISFNNLSPKKITLIANLPYNIATTIILNCVKNIDSFKSMVLMVQKEVAERLSATKKTRNYGRISVLLQVLADIKIRFDVGPENFFPQPKVFSSVIEITPKKKQNLNLCKLNQILKLSFLHKRKTLKNNLLKLDSNIEKKLIQCGINPKSRAEEICPHDFIKLSELLL